MEQKIQYIRISLEDYTKLSEANSSFSKDVEKAMEHRWFVESKNKELTTALDIKEGKILTLEEENKKLIHNLAKLEVEIAHYKAIYEKAEGELNRAKEKIKSCCDRIEELIAQEEVNENVCS